MYGWRIGANSFVRMAKFTRRNQTAKYKILTSTSVTESMNSSCQFPKISRRFWNNVIIKSKGDATQRFPVYLKVKLRLNISWMLGGGWM